MRRPVDTSPEIRERQLAAYRAMSPEMRMRLADEMSTDVQSLAKAGSSARARAGTPVAASSAPRRRPSDDR